MPYYPPTKASALRARDHLTSWTRVQSVQPGVYATTDFDLKKPSQSLLKSHSIKRPHASAGFEIFDYPAELPAMKDDDASALDASEGERIAKVRMQELQAVHAVAHGQGNADGPGCRRTVSARGLSA